MEPKKSSLASESQKNDCAHLFIAELVNLFLDMATNLKKIETTLSDEEATPDL
jgi:hypothetical protein